MDGFDIGKWVMKLLNTSSSYSTLLDFINDEKAFEEHTNNKNVYTTSPETGKLIVDKNSQIKEYFNQEIKNDIEQSIDIYSNQILVILATYIETIHSEFFHTLFSKNNNLMYDYISQNQEHNGYVKINLLFESNSKSEIIDKLINTAKNNVVNGSLKKINDRIFKMTKYQIDSTLINTIQSDIFDKRNLIVHEAESNKITKENIKNYFQLTENYLFELGHACKKIGAPYHDQANWLSKPNKNLQANTSPEWASIGSTQPL